jgi:hypothetical protein
MGLYKHGDIWWYNFVHDGEHIQKSSRMADQAEQLPIISALRALGSSPKSYARGKWLKNCGVRFAAKMSSNSKAPLSVLKARIHRRLHQSNVQGQNRWHPASAVCQGGPSVRRSIFQRESATQGQKSARHLAEQSDSHHRNFPVQRARRVAPHSLNRPFSTVRRVTMIVSGAREHPRG